MCRPSTALAATVAVLFLAAPRARADFIPWAYTSSAASPIAADGDAGSGLTVTGVATLQSATGSLDGISLAQLTPFGSAGATLTNKSLDVTFNLTDVTSGKSQSLTFSGLLNGDLSNGGTGLKFDVGQPSAKTVTLGSNEYTVAFGLYSPPSPGKAGSVGVNVVVVGSGDTPPVTEAPEPSGLALAGVGAFTWLLRRWRQRRRSGSAPRTAAAGPRVTRRG